MHPDAFTLRQLLDMAESRVAMSWGQASYLAAYTHNSGMNAKRAVSPAEINPHLRARQKRRIHGKQAFRELKGMLF